MMYEKSAPIFVTDDAINEAIEQVFVVELRLVSSVDPARVNLTTRPSSLCRIIDYNDCKHCYVASNESMIIVVSLIPL